MIYFNSSLYFIGYMNLNPEQTNVCRSQYFIFTCLYLSLSYYKLKESQNSAFWVSKLKKYHISQDSDSLLLSQPQDQASPCTFSSYTFKTLSVLEQFGSQVANGIEEFTWTPAFPTGFFCNLGTLSKLGSQHNKNNALNSLTYLTHYFLPQKCSFVKCITCIFM